MNNWLTMLLAGLVTFAIRLSFIWIVGQRSVPPLLRRALRLVPPAVLTGIIFPEVFMPAGQLDISFGNARLLAAVLAVLIAWRTRNVVLTIIVGMLSLWLLQGILH
jgi:branched-subunit amino acid transport protein